MIIEVTENEMISGFNQFNSAIKQLRAEGVGLAIDDFGSGYAGLSLLTRFQPDKLKIDREIVSDIHLSGPKQAIVKSIISCCTDLEITLVAEGIEKIEEWCWLEYAGIRRFQGFCSPARSSMAWVISTGPIGWVKQIFPRHISPTPCLCLNS